MALGCYLSINVLLHIDKVTGSGARRLRYAGWRGRETGGGGGGGGEQSITAIRYPHEKGHILISWRHACPQVGGRCREMAPFKSRVAMYAKTRCKRQDYILFYFWCLRHTFHRQDQVGQTPQKQKKIDILPLTPACMGKVPKIDKKRGTTTINHIRTAGRSGDVKVNCQVSACTR